MFSSDETPLVSSAPNGTQATEVHSERIDDIPLLLHILQQMDVPEQIDQAYTPHQNWQGLSLGWVTTVWLGYILTECDHRMNQVRDWVNVRRCALSNLIHQEIRETDFTDDRLAEAERKGLENRLAQAQAALQALTPPPGRGHKQYVEEAALRAAIDQILERYKVTELLFVTVKRKETQRHIRAYGEHPARTETTVRFTLDVTPDTQAIANVKQRLGFRLYATNAPVKRLVLSQAVLTYREQYLAERDFARLHGRHLGITPLYVQRDDHALGLIRLLTLALRARVMIEFLARHKLAQQNATLSGIYAGNPTRSTARPTAERLLATFKEITLTTIRLSDNRLACDALTRRLPQQAFDTAFACPGDDSLPAGYTSCGLHRPCEWHCDQDLGSN